MNRKEYTLKDLFSWQNSPIKKITIKKLKELLHECQEEWKRLDSVFPSRDPITCVLGMIDRKGLLTKFKLLVQAAPKPLPFRYLRDANEFDFFKVLVEEGKLQPNLHLKLLPSIYRITPDCWRFILTHVDPREFDSKDAIDIFLEIIAGIVHISHWLDPRSFHAGWDPKSKIKRNESALESFFILYPKFAHFGSIQEAIVCALCPELAQRWPEEWKAYILQFQYRGLIRFSTLFRNESYLWFKDKLLDNLQNSPMLETEERLLEQFNQYLVIQKLCILQLQVHNQTLVESLFEFDDTLTP
jgi:hypothetical protein